MLRSCTECSSTKHDKKGAHLKYNLPVGRHVDTVIHIMMRKWTGQVLGDFCNTVENDREAKLDDVI
jgi:hypothetical protein